MAHAALKADGYFVDLIKHVEKRMKELDPSFQTQAEKDYVDPVEEKAAMHDVTSFLTDMQDQDQALRGNMAVGGKVHTKIFEDDPESSNKNRADQYAANLEKKRLAEAERYKGNDFMKGKEYNEAVTAYTRSIDLCGTDSASYSNRALAYLRLKNFGAVIEDANKCLELEPGFLKAFHRRGTAYLSTNKFELAIKDFQTILEVDENNPDVNSKLK